MAAGDVGVSVMDTAAVSAASARLLVLLSPQVLAGSVPTLLTI